MKKIWSKILLTLIILVAAILLLISVLKDIKLGLDLQGGFEVLYEVQSSDGKDVTSDMVTSTYKTISKRIDVLGVLEPTIIVEGDNKIRVQLAGIDNADEARNVISQTANLTFRDTSDNLLMTSDVLKSGGAKVGQDEKGKPVVSLSIKDKDEFYKMTKKVSEMEDNRIVIWLDFDEDKNSFSQEGNTCGSLNASNCLSVATVSQGFSSDVIIQGDFETEEVENLVDLINSGSLPTKLVEISSKSVEASFGESSLEKTAYAGVIGIVLIMIFLISIYRISGLFASVGIVVYTSLTFFIFWLVGGTLTLPGVAAIILGIGMAVDANVISFARIKDELYNGRSVQTAFKNGNKSSFGTILDANVTTLIVAIILFIFGQSSVKGFATMLIISIFSTMVIMVFFVRWLMEMFVKTKVFNNKPKLFIGVNPKDVPNVNKGEKRTKFFYKKLDFVKKRKIFLITAIVITILGIGAIITSGLNLGIDFKGGTSVTIKTDEKYTKTIALKDAKNLGYELYSYEELSDGTIDMKFTNTLTKEQSMETEKYFSENYNASTDVGVISNVVKKDLVTNAIISVILAAIGIIIYISLRFKFSYGISAVAALLLNVLVIISLFSIFKLEVSSIFIAAILSVIGYAVNDIIIVFDRIRENSDKTKISSVSDLVNLVNKSLREVLNRSLITIISTLIPVVCLIILGSHEILNFNIALFIGLIFGTLATLFLASQLWLEIEKHNIGKKKKKMWYEEDVDDEVNEMEIKGINS